MGVFLLSTTAILLSIDVTYRAYVAASILPATFLAIGQRLPKAIRIVALLLTIAFAAMAFGSFYPLIPPEAGYVEAIINYTSVLCLALGLAFVWISSLMAKRASRHQPLFFRLSKIVVRKTPKAHTDLTGY